MPEPDYVKGLGANALWLKGDGSRGCDGFRVDMADSLVKFYDGEKSATIAVWRV